MDRFNPQICPLPLREEIDAPALRIGYVVLPHQLQLRWKYLGAHTDVRCKMKTTLLNPCER